MSQFDQHNPIDTPSNVIAVDVATPKHEAHRSELNKLDIEKFKSDLKHGFRIMVKYPGDDRIDIYDTAVVRSGDYTFVVERNTIYVDDNDSTTNHAARISCHIRRKFGQPHSRTVEHWQYVQSEFPSQNNNSYSIQRNKGGVLNEDEFMQHYSTAAYDEEATDAYYEFCKTGTKDRYDRFFNIPKSKGNRTNRPEYDIISMRHIGPDKPSALMSDSGAEEYGINAVPSQTES